MERFVCFRLYHFNIETYCFWGSHILRKPQFWHLHLELMDFDPKFGCFLQYQWEPGEKINQNIIHTVFTFGTWFYHILEMVSFWADFLSGDVWRDPPGGNIWGWSPVGAVTTCNPVVTPSPSTPFRLADHPRWSYCQKDFHPELEGKNGIGTGITKNRTQCHLHRISVDLPQTWTPFIKHTSLIATGTATSTVQTKATPPVWSLSGRS